MHREIFICTVTNTQKVETHLELFRQKCTFHWQAKLRKPDLHILTDHPVDVTDKHLKPFWPWVALECLAKTTKTAWMY